MPDKQGRLSRAEAEAVIRGGGSVSIGGKLYNSVDRLPTEADFAKGDDKAEDAARAKLQATIADAQKQLADLGQSQAGRFGTAAPGPEPTVAGGTRAAADRAGAHPAGEPEPEFHGHKLSSFDNKTDDEILATPGVGDATLKEIKAAQRKRDRAR